MSTQEPPCSTTPRGTEATTVQVRTHHYKTPFLRNTIPKERSIVKVSTEEPSGSTTARGTEATTVQVRTHDYKTPFLRNTIPKERSIVKVSTQEPSCSTTPRGTEATTVQDTASKRLKWTKEDSTTVKKYFQNCICGTRIGYPGKKDILGFLGKHNLPYTWKSIKIKVMNDKRLHHNMQLNRTCKMCQLIQHSSVTVRRRCW